MVIGCTVGKLYFSLNIQIFVNNIGHTHFEEVITIGSMYVRGFTNDNDYCSY